VLVAENGQGKTAVLDAVGIALGTFVDTVASTRQFHGFERTDVRLVKEESAMIPALPTSYEAGGYVAGHSVSWKREVSKYGRRGVRSSTKDTRALRKSALEVRAGIDGEGVLPLVASYGTERLWNENAPSSVSQKKKAAAASGRFLGYDHCLWSPSPFKGFIGWYEQKMDEIGNPAFGAELANSLPLVRAVHEAVRVVLAPVGWQEMVWDSNRRSLNVSHPVQGQLPLATLSDGIRNMIALIADMSSRCAVLNPQFGERAAQMTPGILLIDEVDLHLHPRWQQLVIELVRKAFPAMQIILSTHSPHVLSTVDRQSIRVLKFKDGKIQSEIPAAQTRGVMSADVLASIMGVDPTPETEEATWLSRYRALIEDGTAEGTEARALREKLQAHFGENHPVLVDCDRLIRFQTFRVKKKGIEES
jgi:predicted ATP-binding protein involved in virulence